MKRRKKTLATLCVALFLAGFTTGCGNRFVAGIRKLFVGRPASAVKGQPVERVDRTIKPVVTIEDGAGRQTPDGVAAPDDVIGPEAAAEYRELAMTKPYDPIVRYNVGRLYLQQGLLKEATYEFDMATSLDPEFAEAFVLLGRTLRMRGLQDLAIAKLQRATALRPGDPVAYVESGICWDERGHPGKAQEAYSKALAIAPHDGRIYNNLGYSLFLQGEYKEAIKYYRKALQFDPDDRQTHNNIALAYAMRKRWDKALHHFSVALGEAAAQNNIGHLLLRDGRVDEALAHLELAVRLDPTSIRALGNLESALRLKGRLDEAEELHDRRLEMERAQIRPRYVSSSLEPAASLVHTGEK